MRVALSFILVISMAVSAIYLLKRYVPGWRVIGGDKSQRISVIEVKKLSPKTLLFLVEVDGKTLLLAQSNDRLSTLEITESKTTKLNQPTQNE
jgi:flagellar biogenesis protein FliO